MVVEVLTPLDDSYVLINDVLLPERKGNIDHILVSPNGVFVIETKSYKWHYLNRFPIRQAICSAVSLRYFLKEHLQLDMFIPAILVSTDPDATISQSAPTVNVINLRNLCDFIKDQRNQSVLDDEARKNLIYEILKVSDTTSQKEFIAKKWLLKYIGLLAVGLIVYISYVFSGVILMANGFLGRRLLMEILSMLDVVGGKPRYSFWVWTPLRLFIRISLWNSLGLRPHNSQKRLSKGKRCILSSSL